MEDKKELQVGTPATVIEYAIANKASVEELERLLTLQERYDANQARKLYNIAMAEVHKNMPSVTKAEKNPQTSSKYAGLDYVIKAAKPIYSNEGFAVSFYEGDTKKEGHVRICMDITHAAGHKETYHYDMPLDGKGLKGNVNMTAIHGKSSSVSYGRRYLLCMGFNIATGDDDGNTAGEQVEYISEEQRLELLDIINETKTDTIQFCGFFKIESLDKFPKQKFNNAKVMLNAKKSGKMGPR